MPRMSLCIYIIKNCVHKGFHPMLVILALNVQSPALTLMRTRLDLNFNEFAAMPEIWSALYPGFAA